ncbi:hypothetical protein Aduo_004234 [Ancylostoma duodenale]
MKSLLLLLLYANICESLPAGTRTYPFAGINGQSGTSSTNAATPVGNNAVNEPVTYQQKLINTNPSQGYQVITAYPPESAPVQNQPSIIYRYWTVNNGYQPTLSNFNGIQSYPSQQSVHVDPITGDIQIRTFTRQRIQVMPGYTIYDAFGNKIAEYPTKYINLDPTNPYGGTDTMPANPQGSANVNPTSPNGGTAIITANPQGLINPILRPTNPNGGTATMPANPQGFVNVMPANPNGGTATMPVNPQGFVNVVPTNPNGGTATMSANPQGFVNVMPANTNGGTATMTANPQPTILISNKLPSSNVNAPTMGTNLQPGMNPIATNPSGGIPQKCLETTHKPGRQCMANLLRYTYNPMTQKCEKFLYGGCNPSLNNFETLVECKATCMVR